MTSQTVVADAIDGLYDLLATNATLTAIEGLKVFDGPPLTDRSRTVEVWVGHSGLEDDDIAANYTSVPAGFDDERDEAVDITCAIWGIRGDTTMRVTRRRVANAYDAVIAALAGWTLAGVTPSATADVITGALRQMQNYGGSGVHQSFTVRITGYWS